MLGVLWAIIWVVFYAFLGAYLEANNIIEEPAYWSLYGLAAGCILMFGITIIEE